ncbi:MAG: hypothetical protein V4718_14125 [Pseudomonadota bacterium]
MKNSASSTLKALLLASVTVLAAVPSFAQTLGPGALQQKHAAIASQLAQSAFKRPLLLDSAEAKNSVVGNAYAVIDAPFATVNAVFKDPARWCDVLMLHLNTKGCAASSNVGTPLLVLHVGKKTPQPLKDASRLEFSYRQTAATASYAAAELHAEQGPLGTRNYNIDLETVPLPDGKTFMHLRYGYAYGTAAKLAMQGYLATVAAGKVGFSPADEPASQFVSGVRGAVERNTMRYYLAIEAYLSSLNLPDGQQEQTRLSRWFDSSEQYARQLHEITKAEYMTMKRDELARLQAKTAN